MARLECFFSTAAVVGWQTNRLMLPFLSNYFVMIAFVHGVWMIDGGLITHLLLVVVLVF